MEFAVGTSVEAVDQLGIWAKAKVISVSENSVVVTFPPWRSEWDREKSDLSEIRKETIEETLIPPSSCTKKVRSYSMLILSFFISFSFLPLISFFIYFCHTLIIFTTNIPTLLTILIRLLTLLTILHLLTLYYSTCQLPRYYPSLHCSKKKYLV